MENIILIGFMGCGKSTIGIRLSYKLKMVVMDTDRQIEKEQGKSVSDIFAQEGEAAFRDRETELLQKLLTEGGARIFAVGGGLPLREENRRLLKRLGTVFYLRVSPAEVYSRLEGDDTRPLLQDAAPLQRITELMAKREPLYEEAADVIIDADGKELESVLQEILQYMEVENEDTGD